MAIEIFNRQELKFVTTAPQAKQLMAAIAPFMQADAHNKQGKAYQIYNLYIDTDDHALIRHSLSRPAYKEKLRIRAYEPFKPNSMVFLEVKKRHERITNKRRSRLQYDEALDFVRTGNAPPLQAYMNAQVMRELGVLLSRAIYHPKTFITYDRLAYVSKDAAQDLRITFDYKLTAQRYGETRTQRLLDDNRVILEIKSSRNIPLWLVAILDKQALYKQSFSKYGHEYLGYLREKSQVAAESTPC